MALYMLFLKERYVLQRKDLQALASADTGLPWHWKTIMDTCIVTDIFLVLLSVWDSGYSEVS
ncbi:hypothetical protein D3C73_1646660 [compost metagenome]